MMKTIGFLGCGNMGGAIARAVCKATEPENVFLANRTAAKAETLAAELGCQTATNAEVAGDCDLIFLAVKPQMMEAMLAKKKPMSELAAALKIYPQVLENVRVTDKKAAQNDEAVQTAIKKLAEGLGDTGRILVRESGTEPVVRVMVEAPDHDTCQKYVSEVVDVIRDRGYSL